MASTLQCIIAQFYSPPELFVASQILSVCVRAFLESRMETEWYAVTF